VQIGQFSQQRRIATEAFILFIPRFVWDAAAAAACAAGVWFSRFGNVGPC